MVSSGEGLDPAQIIHLLGLSPHPEGGHYAETWRDAPPDGGRGAGTAIYYMLQKGEVSRWHRVVDACEIWHWYAGAPLALTISPDGRDTETHLLGPDLTAGQQPQAIVPAGLWQTAESRGAWSLVGCTVSPAFVFEGFEFAPDDFGKEPRGG